MKKKTLALTIIGALCLGMAAPVTGAMPETVQTVAYAAKSPVRFSYVCSKCNAAVLRTAEQMKKSTGSCRKGGTHDWIQQEQQVRSKEIHYGPGKNAFALRPVKGMTWNVDSISFTIDFPGLTNVDAGATVPPNIVVYDADTDQKIAESNDWRSTVKVSLKEPDFKGTAKTKNFYFTVKSGDKVLNNRLKTTYKARLTGIAKIIEGNGIATVL